MPLTKKMSAGEVIHDFVHSTNSKFAGKSKAKRKQMALAAYYSKQNEETTNEGSEEARAARRERFKQKAKGKKPIDEASDHQDFMLHLHGAMSREEYMKRKAERAASREKLKARKPKRFQDAAATGNPRHFAKEEVLDEASPKAIVNRFRKNEDQNEHFLNAVHLAKHFGTPEEHKLGKKLVKTFDTARSTAHKEYSDKMYGNYGHKLTAMERSLKEEAVDEESIEQYSLKGKNAKSIDNLAKKLEQHHADGHIGELQRAIKKAPLGHLVALKHYNMGYSGAGAHPVVAHIKKHLHENVSEEQIAEALNEETMETTTPSLIDLADDKNAIGFVEALGARLSEKVSAALDEMKVEVATKMITETTGKKLHMKNQTREMDQAHENEFITAQRKKHGVENTKVETQVAKNGTPQVSNVYLIKNKKKIHVASWNHKQAVGSYKEVA